VAALAVDSQNNVYAGGAFGWVGPNSSNKVAGTRMIAKWNSASSTWSALKSGLSDTVNCIVVSPLGDYIYVGGFFTAPQGGAANSLKNIARWNLSNSSWEAVGGGVNGPVTAIDVDTAGNVYAGGNFTYAYAQNGDPVGIGYNIAKWNKSAGQWEPLGGGLNGDVKGIKVHPSGDVYVTGNFDNYGPYAAKWTGSEWQGLGHGLSTSGQSITSDSTGNIYIGGLALSAYNPNGDPVTVNHIAKWNVAGSQWEGLGAGLSNDWVGVQVLALSVDVAGNVYAGGEFIATSVNALAKWDSMTHAWEPLISSGEVSISPPTLPKVSCIAIDNSGYIYIGGWFTSPGTNIAVAK